MTVRTTIAHVLTSLHVGGAERVALMLARQQIKDGHRVIVLSLRAESEHGPLIADFERLGVRVHHLPKKDGVDPLMVPRIAAVLLRERVDVVHTHNDLPLIYAAPAGKLLRRRVVHTAHGQRPASSAQKQLQRIGAMAADCFVAVSEATAEYMLETQQVSRHKLRVILNATDLSEFRPDLARRSSARAAWGLSDEARILGSVGRLAEVKNQQLMLRAAAPLLQDGRCDALVLAGGGELRDDLDALAAELGVSASFRAIGEISNVPEVMAGLDLFTLSSHSEGLPLVLAEAMACGLPVVATDVGGVAKVVEHGTTGYIVPAGDEDALRERYLELLSDPTKAREMGAAGRTIAQQRYSMGRMAQDYARAYGIA